MEVGIWGGCVEVGRLGRVCRNGEIGEDGSGDLGRVCRNGEIEVGIWGGCVEMGRLGRVCSTKY